MDTESITQLPAQLRKISDPTARAQAATALLQLIPEIQQEIKDIRRDDVLELRRTLKLREVAELLGMSIPRVDQISKGR
jgi:hypothetical protein